MNNRPMIILAGGFGTRLKSVLNGLPKPLADINGKPFIEYLFQNWIDKGFNNFILSLHYQSDIIIKFINKNKQTLFKNCQIRCIVEPTPMGTGGAVSYIIKQLNLKEDIFIVNADTWIEQGYSEINNFSKDVIAVVKVKNTSRFGTVILNKNDQIIDFKEKLGLNTSGLINAGLYKLNIKYFTDWNYKPYSIESNLFPNLVKKGLLYAKIIDTNFIDIGIPEDYEIFCNIKFK